jgi:RES domain
MKLRNCGKLAHLPLSGHWFRALNLKNFETRLATDHTRTAASRFSSSSETAPLHRILYLAENHQVALYEAGAMLGSPTDPIADPTRSLLLLSLKIRLCRVADLCEEAERRLIGTSFQELTGKWRDSPDRDIPTHRLGLALFRVKGLEGFLFPSSKPSGGRNLVVFPDKIDPGRSSILFRNDLSGDLERLS